MVMKIGIAAALAAALLAAPSASFAAAKKSSSADWRNTPIPNQSAQFYRSTHHKTTKHTKSDSKS